MKITELTGIKNQLAHFPNSHRVSHSEDAEWAEKLVSLGFDIVGQGAFGTVFSSPRLNYVIKVFNADDIGYATWVRYCVAEKTNPHVPKFRGRLIKLKDGVFGIRLERLTTNHDLAEKYVKFAEIVKAAEQLGTSLSDQINGYMSPSFKDSMFTIAEQYPELTNTMQDIFWAAANNRSLMFDMHLGNIMFRGNVPVIVDPLSTPEAW